VTYAERATAYATRVVAGEIPACRLVKLACQRHLGWLDKYEDECGDYFWDVVAANRVCGFVELMPHTKGKWQGTKIHLEDWQCFIVCVPFGWVWRRSGLRVFRRAYTEVPRKNAKSTLTAAIALYMMTMDGEPGAEVYSGAGTEKQAWEVFGPARWMAKNTPQLVEAFGLEVNARSLVIPTANAKFEPIIGKPGDGASPSFSVTDEYHEHATDEQYDTMVTGMGAREQPMAWVITTAGDDTAGPCYALRGEVVDVLTGTTENDQLFGIVYTIDEDVDWTSRAALEMANPNLGVSVFEDYLLNQQRDAVNDPRKQSTFKKKHLDIWVTAASPFFNLELWNRLGDAALAPEQFADEPAFAALDLASKRDLAAYVLVFRKMVDGEPHFYAFGRFYVPEARTESPEHRHYQGWAKTGHVIATPGNITDYDYIEGDVKEDAGSLRLERLGFDKWDATQLVTHLMDFGVECVEIPQTVDGLSDPMKWLDALIVDGRIHHDANPAFGWQIGNVTAKRDFKDNVFPRKEGDEKKIDGAVALIMCIRLAMSEKGSSLNDRYADEGLLVLG